ARLLRRCNRRRRRHLRGGDRFGDDGRLACAAEQRDSARDMSTDAHWAGLEGPRRHARVTSRSLFVPMRDGVKIAIDLHLPATGERMPAILRQTRYLRALEAHPLASALGLPSLFDINARTRRLFLEAGYAWIDVDVRGTGASGGVWRAPWFEDEVKDG